MEEAKRLINNLKKIKSKNMLVIGDLILDRFIRGKVSRISPEAPVPVVEVNGEEEMPGGCGNVVCNLLNLNAKVHVGGVIGDDLNGRLLLNLLDKNRADVSGIHKVKNRPTSIKTRIIAEHQQVVRTDREIKDEIDAGLVKKIIKWMDSLMGEIEGIIISDYGKGLITTELIDKICSTAFEKNIPVVVDPKVGHFFEYKEVTSITPNLKEIQQALNINIVDEKTLIQAGNKLLEALQCKSVLITRGEQGMSLFEPGKKARHIPTMAKEVYDVTGAGDTVISVFGLGLAAGLDYYPAAQIANYAAAVVVGKLGTASASEKEIIKEIEK
ncbi:MAG: D-glycero-beta-D-manno-heptose-7-phosphate kinase [Elusimicrobiota bacterium]